MTHNLHSINSCCHTHNDNQEGSYAATCRLITAAHGGKIKMKITIWQVLGGYKMIRSWSECFLPGIKLQSAASLNGSTAATVPNPRTQLLTPDHNVWLSLPASFETGSYKISRRCAGVKTGGIRGESRWQEGAYLCALVIQCCSRHTSLSSGRPRLHFSSVLSARQPHRCCVKAAGIGALNRKPALQNIAWKIDTELQPWLYSGTADAI